MSIWKGEGGGRHLFVLALEGIVVANDAAGLGPVLVGCGHAVRKVAQRRERLFHIQDVAVDVHALHACAKAGCSSARQGVNGHIKPALM